MGLFSTNEDIKAKLRLSGMPTTGDGEEMFLRALLRASVTIRRALGINVVTLVGASSVLIQDHAKLVEYDLVLCELAKTMPYASLDGSAGMDNWFDKEAPFRHLDEDERSALIDRMCGRAEDDLAEIAGDLKIPYKSEAGVDCFIIEGETLGCFPEHRHHQHSLYGSFGC